MSLFSLPSLAGKVILSNAVIAALLALALPIRTVGAESPPIEASLQSHRQAIADARSRAREKDPAGVEAALAVLCRAVPNSDEWYLETAQKIVHFVDAERKEGRRDVESELLFRATQNLGVIERRSADRAVRARAFAFLGFVLERHVGNHKGALAAHRAALELSPALATASKQAIERLERTSAVTGENEISKP